MEIKEVEAERAKMDLIAGLIVDEIEHRKIGERGVWPDHRYAEWAESGGVTVDGKLYFPKINPASVDLAISAYVRRPKWYWRNPVTRRLVWPFLSIDKRDIRKHIDLYWGGTRTEYPIIMWPGDFILCSSRERIVMPDDAIGTILSKSTTGRIGAEHCHSGYIDCGFQGHVTFELFNPAPWPIELYPGDFYLQLVIADMSSAPNKTYNGRYQGQTIYPQPAKEEA